MLAQVPHDGELLAAHRTAGLAAVFLLVLYQSAPMGVARAADAAAKLTRLIGCGQEKAEC